MHSGSIIVFWDSRFRLSYIVPLTLGLLVMSSSCGSSNTTTTSRTNTEKSAPAEPIRIPRIQALARTGTGAVTKTEGGWHISSKGNGEFAAIVPLNGFAGDWTAIVEVRARVTAGKIGFGLLTSDTRVLDEHVLEPTADDQTLSFSFASRQSVQNLLLRGVDVKGKVSEATIESADLVFQGALVPGGAPLSKLELAQPTAVLEMGPPARIVTPVPEYTYAAMLPLAVEGASGLLLLKAKVKVVHGEVGVGVLNKDIKSFQAQEFFTPQPQSREVFIPILNPALAGSVIVRNGRVPGASEALLEAIGVYSVR